MPYNGVGLFTRIYQWGNDEALGLFVDATRTDTDSNDIADGLSNCVTRDGQSPWTADLPAGGKKITGLGTGSATGDSVNYGQVFNNPVFTNASSAATIPITDNSLKYATTAFVVAMAFQSTLPNQSGHANQYVKTDGSTAAWSYITLTRSARTSNTVLDVADAGNLIDITSGTFAQTFAACATLGNGWQIKIKNSGTGDITLTPNGGEQIDGLSSFVMYPNETRIVYCDGTTLRSIVIRPFKRVWTISGNFINPPGYVEIGGKLVGSGNSGQRTNNVATASAGGGGAGAFPVDLPSSAFGAYGSSTAITIGAGGLAVTGVANGNLGGNTSIGSLLTIFNASLWRSGGSIRLNLTSNSIDAAGFDGGLSTASIGYNAVWGGSAASQNGANNGSSVHGGGCGGSLTAAAAVTAPGTSVTSGSGGAASSTGNGSDGVAPGGGGGATQTGTQSGAGARGEVQLWGKV